MLATSRPPGWTRVAASWRTGLPPPPRAPAREAIAIQPWAAEPWLQLATVERSVDNTEAAARAAREAIERSPDDFRLWLLASVLAGSGEQPNGGISYAVRASQLAPTLLLRLPEFATDPGS